MEAYTGHGPDGYKQGWNIGISIGIYIGIV